jgi:glycosyltransferase involved in cell wall biosynthesis
MKQVLVEMEKLKNLNSGLGQFCINLGNRFQKIHPENIALSFYIPAAGKNIFGSQFNYVQHSVLNKIIPLNSNKYNIWHCIHQDSHYLPSDKKTKLILTIHDLNFLEKYKGDKQKRKLNTLQKKVDRASAITVISNYTGVIVRQHLNTGNTPIHVIHNGNCLIPIESAAKPDFIKFPSYILFVGIVSAKKNLHTILPLLEKNKELHFVIAGNNASVYAKQLEELAEKIGVKNQLHVAGVVDAATKYWLYKNCMAFVFPSLTEGFGLPVIEAMSLGKPVFLSNLTSLPEVGGEEAFYWNNFEPGYMLDVFEKGMQDFDPARAARSIAWSKQFSWEGAAKEYLKLYETI